MRAAATEEICNCKETDCNDSACFNIETEKILGAISSINTLIYNDSKEKLQKIQWNYSCELLSDEDLIKLFDYRDALFRVMRNAEYEVNAVLCAEQVYGLFSVVHDYVGKFEYSEEIEIDSSEKEDWDIENPGCVAYESWEEAYYNKYLPTFTTRTSDVERATYFAYTISSKQENKNVLPIFKAVSEARDMWRTPEFDISSEIEKPCFSLDIESKLKECNINYEITSTPNECNLIDFDIGVTLKQCETGLKAVTEEESCNIGLDAVTEEEFCQIVFDITGQKI